MRTAGKGSRHCGAELHTASCNRPAHPTLACVCLGRAMHINTTPLLEDRTKLFVLLFRVVGVLLFCQPSVCHQSMSNAFSLVCCTCTLSACCPLLTVRVTSEFHLTYLDVTISLLLQGTELRPRKIHYADDTVLLFPQLPFLLCLLFFDALSHHLHVFLFLFVSVDFEVEMASHDETAAPDQPAG